MEKKFSPSLIEEIAGAFEIAAMLLLSPILAGWYSRWGATREEFEARLPGDEIAPKPQLRSTRAITIQAPIEAVWPWIAQIGQGRGGLYSFQRLENIAGCKIENAERILPEHQNIQPGDKVRLGPEGYPCYPVVAVKPGEALVMGGIDEKNGDGHSWLFQLKPCGANATRLVVRTCTAYRPGFGNFLMWRVFTDPINFIMERTMLLGIKRRAEYFANQPNSAYA